MIPVRRRALLLLVLTSFSTLAIAGSSNEAREWLERMVQAMQQMTYQGTFVYVRGGDVETMRITHMVDESGVRERLYSVSGPHREVIRDHNGVRCVLEDSASVVEDQVLANSYFPELPLSLIDSENNGYRLETGGLARIAGHSARRVSISPADNFRYGYDFWLEQQTGLLLKWVLLDSKRKPLAKLMFTDFSIGADVKLAEIESDSKEQDFVKMKTISPEKAVVTKSTPRWVPANLPPGFQLAAHNHKSGSGEVYEHMVYSDGLTAVSVYIEEKDKGNAVKPGISKLGTNYAFVRDQGGLRITVIGEVPVVTVKSIANEIALSVAAD
ncbi:MAG: MucB/RseB C-terminal domain-containing protein [Xanthomonadales bacterium]|nr:MucB/RseB C-terminal domain-containing protein [Xanthomonadales bacterium]